MGKYSIRAVRTASKATAIQVVWYEGRTIKIAKHLGSARNEDELKVLRAQAEQYVAAHEPQRSLFQEKPSRVVLFDQIEAKAVSHKFARQVLHAIAEQCGLGFLHTLYRDLAMMRIIEPCSKRRSIELLEQHFNVSYTNYLYELLPKLLEHHTAIETAAIETAKTLCDTFSFVLYDVTTLYFETHKPDDELQARGFSKDDKSKQPQVVIGLLVTAQGFPLAHQVFKGNMFEGHTMLTVLEDFQARYGAEKPVIVGDAAMLSQSNLRTLEDKGYYYIVGARLANAKATFIEALCNILPKNDGASIRMPYQSASCDVICTYSEARYRKDKRDFNKQIEKANRLIARQEPGKRAKFVKKKRDDSHAYFFDEELKQKTEQLLGIKGYCTNLPESLHSNEQVVSHYHELWHIEQAFRMSKSDLKARPIFHHEHDSIRAHLLICFMALMIGKFIEIKTGLSLRVARDLLWQVHEIHLHDPETGMERTIRTQITYETQQLLDFLNIKNT